MRFARLATPCTCVCATNRLTIACACVRFRLLWIRHTCGVIVLLLRPAGVWMYKQKAKGDPKLTERAQKLTPVRSLSKGERWDFLLPRTLCTCTVTSERMLLRCAPRGVCLRPLLP